MAAAPLLPVGKPDAAAGQGGGGAGGGPRLVGARGDAGGEAVGRVREERDEGPCDLGTLHLPPAAELPLAAQLLAPLVLRAQEGGQGPVDALGDDAALVAGHVGVVVDAAARARDEVPVRVVRAGGRGLARRCCRGGLFEGDPEPLLEPSAGMPLGTPAHFAGVTLIGIFTVPIETFDAFTERARPARPERFGISVRVPGGCDEV
mmetsp:Transcript_109887/g.310923  ORF Transcript_109887/g.310923 Transcript_109887/m.310923 type:complete len:205 (-) Transcript_109887:561-1175(-)